ncbi:hypothetical protein TNCV_3405251 [Trichonephila clavipes]|nr:hypothetical protein TNCV_3405251 [Trichonephila clavipes]
MAVVAEWLCTRIVTGVTRVRVTEPLMIRYAEELMDVKSEKSQSSIWCSTVNLEGVLTKVSSLGLDLA